MVYCSWCSTIKQPKALDQNAEQWTESWAKGVGCKNEDVAIDYWAYLDG